MSYRKEDIPYLLRILNGLKPYLWDGKNDDDLDSKSLFVCLAAKSYNRKYNPLETGYSLVCFDNFIESMLDGHYTFSSWYRTKIEGRELSYKKFQSLRLQWVNKMIKDLEQYQKA